LAAARSVTSAETVATPDLDGFECLRPPSDHGDFCAFSNKRFNQTETKAAASTGDNRTFVFEVHLFCSNACVKLRRSTVRKRVRRCATPPRVFGFRRRVAVASMNPVILQLKQ